jgi:chlorophyll/bacteriochlorophyll a synthase
MANLASTRSVPSYPSAGAVLELLKPITWFPPMWAFGCGVVSAGGAISANWMLLLAGMALSGRSSAA